MASMVSAFMSALVVPTNLLVTLMAVSLGKLKETIPLAPPEMPMIPEMS